VDGAIVTAVSLLVAWIKIAPAAFAKTFRLCLWQIPLGAPVVSLPGHETVTTPP
tara:strand:+ start:80648 stop:80809 length:162 start_codon:yes stop_codon:yes gene_type:complete